MKAVLIAGFGNLGCKLLPLQWAFPQARFFVVERFRGDKGQGYLGMKAAFDKDEALGEFLENSTNDQTVLRTPAEINLEAFREALIRVHRLDSDSFELEQTLAQVFEEAVYFCGDSPGGKANESREEDKRYQELVEELLKIDKGDILLYLAARPFDYGWYLERFSPFVGRVAVDKPLATNRENLNDLRAFYRLNPDLEIRPVDHYLFKFDFQGFNLRIHDDPSLFEPRDINRIEVRLSERGLDEFRPYFVQTGIIRDMMPHVSAMLRYMFREHGRTRPVIGTVVPVVHRYEGNHDTPEFTDVQASICVNYWIGERFNTYVPVSIQLAKGVDRICKEIVIHYRSGRIKRIDLARPTPRESEQYVDWRGALRYLLEEKEETKQFRQHFTFDLACEITEEVLACHAQAFEKMEAPSAEGRAYRLSDLGSRGRLGKYPMAKSERKVFVFNFDGVVVNTVGAHPRAWNTWHALLGVEMPFKPGVEPPAWYKRGKANRVMVEDALVHLASIGAISEVWKTKNDQLFPLFNEILRTEQLNSLRRGLKSEGKKPAKSEDEGSRARRYHGEVARFLDRLQSDNYEIVLASTNDALLVWHALQVLRRKFKNFPGFCRHFVGGVGGATGSQIYESILKAYGKWSRVVVFDDYCRSLKNIKTIQASLATAASSSRIEAKVTLVHLRTDDDRCGAADHSFADFGEVMKEYDEIAGQRPREMS